MSRAPGPTSARYDALWSGVYGDMASFGPTHRHLRRLTRHLLRDLAYDSVLDVGCGQGDNFELLCHGRTVSRVAGVDVSHEALERARRRHPGVELSALDICLASLPRRFDLVHAALLLEHVEDDDVAVRNLAAMTKDHLLVSTMAGDYGRYRRWEQKVGHVRNYRVGEVEAKLERAGLVVRTSVYWGFPFYSPLARLAQEATGAGAHPFGAGSRTLSRALYLLYFLNSNRRGDIVLVLATR